MNDQAKHVSRPWHRYLRFSLRGLIALLLVIGTWLGWIVRNAGIQREAVVAIQKAGGSVAYDWEWTNEKSIPGGEPPAPRWLVDLIGADYFGHVASVSLSQTGSGATYAQVERLTRLERLNLLTSSLDYSGLARLKGLTNLAVLSLIGTKVTDADLVNLKGLTKLTVLDLASTQVTDAGFVHLADQSLGTQPAGHTGHRRRSTRNKAGTAEPEDRTLNFTPSAGANEWLQSGVAHAFRII